MKELISGYRRFRDHRWLIERDILTALAEHGQKPHTLAIACSDSRVAPEMIFDGGAGDIFTVRNIANLVPPYAPDKMKHGVSAAIEFAVRVLGVKCAAVIGHSLCGGINALMSGAPPEAADFVSGWVGIAAEARERALAAHPCNHSAARHACEVEAIRVSLGNLRGFPYVAEAEAAGQLVVLGLYFDVVTGSLSRVLPDRVVPIEEPEALLPMEAVR